MLSEVTTERSRPQLRALPATASEADPSQCIEFATLVSAAGEITASPSQNYLQVTLEPDVQEIKQYRISYMNY